MRNIAVLLALIAAIALGPAMGTAPDAARGALLESDDMNPAESQIRLTVNGVPIAVQWERNEAVDALGALVSQGDVTVQTRRYGGFEQVGALPTRLPDADATLTAAPGDIMLYASDQIVLFFGSNTWEYTRLGRIEAMTDVQLAELLGAEGAVLVLTEAD